MDVPSLAFECFAYNLYQPKVFKTYQLFPLNCLTDRFIVAKLCLVVEDVEPRVLVKAGVVVRRLHQRRHVQTVAQCVQSGVPGHRMLSGCVDVAAPCGDGMSGHAGPVCVLGEHGREDLLLQVRSQEGRAVGGKSQESGR